MRPRFGGAAMLCAMPEQAKNTGVQHHFSGSPFEPAIGISRAVRAGDYIFVSGTAPLLNGKTVGHGDAGLQAHRCAEIIEDALRSFGADRHHVIRTRIFLTRISDWQAVAAVHAEFFGEARPASILCEVKRFIDPDWLVEIEADAYFPETH
jgi:enamine deaminase RidA (YjgF/YER057c/UK114 family)